MQGISVEILAIGNEVLLGDVLDTNSHWLCQQLRAAGAGVQRITVLPDVPEVIAEALLGALERDLSLILTCGGLGPTVDDLTLAAVATALRKPVQEHPAALAMVAAVYEALLTRGIVVMAELTPARRKMALLPEGAVPLYNSAGAAPGVWLESGKSIVACLPGVPAEMKAIFSESLWPRFIVQPGFALRPAFAERSIGTTCYDESILAPAVDAVAARHPLVYVSSRAQAYGSGQADFVTLSTRAADQSAVGALLDAAEADLRGELGALGS